MRPAGVSRQKSGNQTLTMPSSSTADTPFMPVRGRRLSINASWTGGTGAFSLQGTNDNGVTVFTIPGASAEFTANGNAQPAGAGTALWNWSNVPCAQVRLRYTATSSTGTLTYTAIWGD